MTAASDLDLVDAFLERGQDAAYVQLIQRHQIPVFRRLSVELADPDDAEAVCETVFLVASQRLGEWPRDIELREWFLHLAAEVGESRRGEAIDPESPRLVDPAEFFRQSVHRALHTLEPRERAILLSVDLEGQSVEEVAERERLSVERVTEALENARATFATMISRGQEKDGAPKETAPLRVEPGEIVDNRYRVEELLGEGGMAAVFRAEHIGIKRQVALKTLHPTKQTQGMIRERFIREAEVLGKLAHPNFVDISDFGESSRGMAYLVMELLHGRPLSVELREKGKLHPVRALRVLREVALGLKFAHELGIIHRDIKPDNIVVLDDASSQGFAKILDLGVAATSDDSGGEETVLYGTPAYMAPEQIQGGRIDGRVDLYAAGIMLFELLTGDVPFRGGTIEFILAQHLTYEVPSLLDVDDLPQAEALQRLVQLCVKKDATQRIGNAGQLIQEIDSVLALFEDAIEEPHLQRSEIHHHEQSAHHPTGRERAWFKISGPMIWGSVVIVSLVLIAGWLLW